MISVLSQKSMVVQTKQISSFPWLVQNVWWFKKNSFRDFRGYSKKYGGKKKQFWIISVLSQKSMVVKTKQFS